MIIIVIIIITIMIDNNFVAKHVKYPLKGNFLGKKSREKIGFPHSATDNKMLRSCSKQSENPLNQDGNHVNRCLYCDSLLRLVHDQGWKKGEENDLNVKVRFTCKQEKTEWQTDFKEIHTFLSASGRMIYDQEIECQQASLCEMISPLTGGSYMVKKGFCFCACCLITVLDNFRVRSLNGSPLICDS